MVVDVEGEGRGITDWGSKAGKQKKKKKKKIIDSVKEANGLLDYPGTAG